MSPSTINVAVLHGQADAREALCDFIADQVGFRIVVGTGLPHQVAELLRAVPVHVHALVVHQPSVGEGLAELIGCARAASPGAGIVMLLGPGAPVPTRELMPTGAAACIAEDDIGTELVGALRTIALGRRYRPA